MFDFFYDITSSILGDGNYRIGVILGIIIFSFTLSFPISLILTIKSYSRLNNE